MSVTGSSLGRVSTTPSAPSSLCSSMNTTVNSKFGSLSEGLATRMSSAGGHVHLRVCHDQCRVGRHSSRRPRHRRPRPAGWSRSGRRPDDVRRVRRSRHGGGHRRHRPAPAKRRPGRAGGLRPRGRSDRHDCQHLSIAGVKTGLLGSAAIVEVVADRVDAGVLPAPVVDPVLVDGRGHRFVGEEIEQAYRERLLPAAVAITPNLGEASLLAGRPLVSVVTSTQSLTNSPALAPPMWSSPAGPTAATAVDVLVRADGTIDHLESPWIDTVHVRRSGCTFAAATAAALAATRMRSAHPSGEGVRHGSAAGIAVGRSRRAGRLPTGSPVSGPVLAESVGEPQSTCSHSSP